MEGREKLKHLTPISHLSLPDDCFWPWYLKSRQIKNSSGLLKNFKMADTLEAEKHSGVNENAQRLLDTINDIESRLRQARKAYHILYGNSTLQDDNHGSYQKTNLKTKRAGRKQKLRDIIFWKGQFLRAVKENKHKTKCFVFK
ncbi:hypothetical protein KQX54_011514 [Cotesia glomerata]|uniref:Uncharacterized protein n=1 Tax=Cotesia glomerata TaxID=32391 RepID=A0AAV7I2W2_COTGL|nr:hypothetical protein KQX54_011514 [Cotesia glomerata]